MERRKESRERIYLSGSFWKRVFGYFLVALLSFLLGISFGAPLQDLTDFLYYMDRTQGILCAICILYILLTAFLFMVGYVSLYSQRSTNIGFKFIILCECVLFIGMIYYFLYHSVENYPFFLLILYGFLNLSGMLFYIRLTKKQLEYVRYELLWPAVYTIALSAYMGYVLILYYIKHSSTRTLFSPILLLLLYEYILFLDEGKEKNNRWLHVLVFIVFTFMMGVNDFCKTAMYFLLFCGASVILEALDVIKRKKDDIKDPVRTRTKEMYESAMCVAVCILLFVGSIWAALIETIPLIHVIVFIGMVELYSMIFFQVWKHDYYDSQTIDLIKILFFIGSVCITVLFVYKEIDVQTAVDAIFNKAKFAVFISSTIINLGGIYFKGIYKKSGEEVREFLKKSFFHIKDVRQYRVKNLFLYLWVVFCILEVILASPLWAERKTARMQVITLVLCFFSVGNLLLILNGIKEERRPAEKEERIADGKSGKNGKNSV